MSERAHRQPAQAHAPEDAVADAPTAPEYVVGDVNDPAEARADRYGKLISAALGAAAPASALAEPEGRIQRAPMVAPVVPSGSAGQPARMQRSALSAAAPEGGAVDDETAADIGRIRRSGWALDPSLRDPIEAAVGHDLSDVRVHTGRDADRVSRSINARAFAVDRDLFFADGAFNPATAEGRFTLGHELGHVIEGSETVQRLWGFGNTGRSAKDEDKVIDETKVSAQDAGSSFRFTPIDNADNYGDFNRLIRLLSRPDAAATAAAYESPFGNNRSLVDDMEYLYFGAFQIEYVKSLIANKGKPPILLRIRLALGAASYGAKSVTSDQAEAMRMIYALDSGDLRTLMKNHRKEVETGVSAKAFKQLLAMYRGSKGLADAKPDADGSAELPRNFRVGYWDDELGKIVDRAVHGESTFADKIAVKMTVNIDQMIDDVKGWVARAKQVEKKFFGGQPAIRNYVLGISNDPSDPDRNPPREFMKKVSSKYAAKIGWNAGDRLMIKMLIAGGSVTAGPADAAPDPQAESMDAAVGAMSSELSDKTHTDLVKQAETAAARCNPQATRAIQLLAAIGAELVIQKKRGARSRTARVAQALAEIEPSDLPHLSRALTGVTKVDQATQNAAGMLLNQMLRAAKVKYKEILAGFGRMVEATSSPEYVEVRRYAGKRKFKQKKFEQRLAALSPDQLATARADKPLLSKLLWHERVGRFDSIDSLLGALPIDRLVAPSGQVSADAADGFEDVEDDELQDAFEQDDDQMPADAADGMRDVEDDELQDAFDQDGGQMPADAADGMQDAAPPVHEDPMAAIERAEREAAESWAARWAALILNTKKTYKVYDFAFDIVGEIGYPGLHRVYRSLVQNHADAHAKLAKRTLGQALAASASFGSGEGEYDLVKKVIGKAKTKRPNGSANVDSICHAFESLSGKTLLAEWTDFPLNGEVKEGVPIQLRLREDRRSLLNDKWGQLESGEFFEVTKRFAKHLSTEITTGKAGEYLGEEGISPTQRQSAAMTMLYVAEQAKQANYETWCQWATFTVRGQLRAESSAQTRGRKRHFDAEVAEGHSGDDLEAASKALQDSLGETERRGDKFKITADKYTARVKRIVSTILDLVIMASTLGIGAVPSLAKTIIGLVFSISKDLVLNVLSKYLQPSEYNLLADTAISVIKRSVSAALSLGIDQVEWLLGLELKLTDADGLTGGSYWDATASKVITVDALKFGSAEMAGFQILSNYIMTPTEMLANRLVDTGEKALTTEGIGAWKKSITSLNWADAAKLLIGPVASEGFVQLRRQIVAATKGKGILDLTVEKKQQDMGPGKDALNIVQDNAATFHGMTTGYADNSKLVQRHWGNYGDKLGRSLGGKVLDATAMKLAKKVVDTPPAQLDAMLSRKAQKAEAVKRKGMKGPTVEEEVKEVIVAIDNAHPLSLRQQQVLMLSCTSLVELVQELEADEEMQDFPDAPQGDPVVFPDAPQDDLPAANSPNRDRQRQLAQ